MNYIRPQTEVDAQRLVRLFDQLFNETEPKTAEEVDEILREAGYNPHDIASRMKALAETTLAKYSQLVYDKQGEQGQV